MAWILWLLSLSFASAAIAQSLTEVLRSRSELSIWYNLIQPQWETLNGFKNITFLAPNNDAMLSYFNNPQISGCASSNSDILNALTSYHTLQQAYESFPGTSWFYTKLIDYKYSSGKDNATFIDTPNFDFYVNSTKLVSGLNAVSNLVSPPIPFSGGFIFIIDAVLQLPANTTDTLIAAGYTAFAGAIFYTATQDIANSRNIDFNVPTNAAFQEVGDTMRRLTAADAKAMVLYHMMNQSDLPTSGYYDGPLPTLLGTNVTFSNSSDSLSYVNNALTDDSSYFFSAGSPNIWIIEEVLNPNNASAPINSTAWPSPSKVAYVPFESSILQTSIPLCEKPVWLDSVLHPANSHKNVGAIAGGVIGGVLGVVILVLTAYMVLRRRKRRSSPESGQEIDGAETFGRPELKGNTHMPGELGPEQKHELGAKQNYELTAEEKYELSSEKKEYYELEGDLKDIPELEAHRSPTETESPVSAPSSERTYVQAVTK